MNAVNRPTTKMFAAVMGGSAVVAFGAMGVGLATHALNQHTTISADETRNATSRNSITGAHSVDPPAAKTEPKRRGPIPNPSEPSEHPNNKK